MAPYIYDKHGRRITAPSKGERREQAILDGAEAQLSQLGADAMTVESITKVAGITRAGLYFYFRSKNDVLAALVRRCVDELITGVAASQAAEDLEPGPAIEQAIDRTADLWGRHGSVMRAAVDLSASVPAIAELWGDARDRTHQSATAIAVRAGIPGGPGPDDAPAIVRALVNMTERSFYDASRDAMPLEATAATLVLVWRRALNLGA